MLEVSNSMIIAEQPFFKQIVGLDLGGGRGKSTAVAILDLTSERPTLVSASVKNSLGQPWRDDELTALLSRESQTTLICLDAPLSLPPCMQCSREHCPGVPACPDPAVERMRAMAPGKGKGGKPRFSPYTQRPQDLELLLAGLPVTGAMDASRGPLSARTHHMLKRLSGGYRPGANLIEVPLPAALQVWFGKKAAQACRRSGSLWNSRAAILEAFGTQIAFAVWRDPILTHGHIFSAVSCAVAGLTWWREKRKQSLVSQSASSIDDPSFFWIPSTAWEG